MKEDLNKEGIEIPSMARPFSTFDGISAIFFIFGGLLIVLQQAENLGWVLIVVGIVKQLLEWKE